MNTETEYDTIAKARAYLGMIISAGNDHFGPEGPVRGNGCNVVASSS